MADPAPDGERQLWILRHADAADVATGGRDQDRSLTDRGRRDASALGARLAAPGPPFGTPGLVRPHLALCSASVRTVETAELVLAGSADRVPLDVHGALYQARVDTVLTFVREIDEHARSVLMIGHNPTVFHLAWDLLTPGSGDRERLEAKGFATCALAVIALGTDAWEDVDGGRGSLRGLFAPPY